MIDIIKYLLAKKKGAQKNIALLYSMGVIPTMAKLEEIIEKTVTGDIIHITDATGDNAVALSVALAPTQDGTPWISDTLNTEPYLSRAAQNGNTADETIVGGTVAW